MTSPILSTRLLLPPGPSVALERPRLFSLLDEGLEKQLILLSGPAGSGKTTILAEWLSRSRRKTAWISLDRGESDPFVFIAYVIAALRRTFSGIGEEADKLLAQPMPAMLETVLSVLVNEAAEIEEPFFLALDDYQEIDSRETDSILTFLIEHGPRALHIAMATREDPGFPLARLRARGQLLELRAEDLRFTNTEASAYLKASGVKPLSAAAEAAIIHGTEGWIAGLHLVALSLRGSEDPAKVIEGLSKGNRFILGYLVEEVMACQPQDMQDFLLKTSILDRFCASLGEAVIGQARIGRKSAALIEELERANLFVVHLDSEGIWYRYHHLFKGFLERRSAGDDNSKAEITAARLRASVWLEMNGLLVEAFRQALAADDISRAAALVISDDFPSYEREAVNEVLQWLSALSAKDFEGRPALATRYATLLLARGRTQGVDGILDAAERELAIGGTELVSPGLIASLAIARATLALTRYDIPEMSAKARFALEMLEPEDSSLRGTALWIQGLGQLLGGNLEEAAAACAEALAASRQACNPFTAMLAMAVKGQAQEGKGRLDGAAATYRDLLALAGEHPQPAASEAHFGLARIAYERDDRVTADREAREGIALARQYGTGIDRSIVGELILVRLAIASGDAAGAERHAADLAREAVQNGFAQRLPEIAVLRSLAAERAGKTVEAMEWSVESGSPLALAATRLSAGLPAEALEAVAPHLAMAKRRGWTAEVIRASLTEALALRDLGRREESLAVLRCAIVAAEESGYVRSFIDLGPRMARLLSEVEDSGSVGAYARVLRARWGNAPESGGGYAVDGSSAATALRREKVRREKARVNTPDASEVLSGRETEVLRLIEQGLSNEEICERLFIALDTVKGHNRRIFEKLGVKRRTEAVARARESGIL